MKKIIPFLLLGGILTPLVTIAYAVNTNNNVQKQYKISFESNGGNSLSSIIYINEDESIKLPTPKKLGYVFGGWYFDNDTFNQPFYVGKSEINKDTTLYAKWVVKTVKVYLDTFNEDEFEPLIYNVGDTFHLSSLPTKVKNKNYNGISFSFKNWVRGNELPAEEDFVLEDEYYEFHATYGSIDYSIYSKSYETTFDKDYGYIDNNNSWSRGELTLPKAGIGEGSPNQGVFFKNDCLTLNQLTYNGVGYGAKALLPYTITNNLKKYSIETTFKISKQSGLSSENSKASDAGFGIMVGYNNQTGANVEAVVDPISKMVRIAGINNAYAKSSTDVNKLFSYNITSSLDEYHKLKVIYNGETPNQAGQLKNSYIEVYFDDVKCWSTKEKTLNKNWFYNNQANGDYIGLCANLCEADVKEVVLKDFEETDILYSIDFSKQNNVFDGWSYLSDSNGANVGQVDIKNGKLHIDSYFKNQSIKKHQAIYSPSKKLKNFAVTFDFNFGNTSDIDKYLAFMFRGNKAQYNALFFRCEKGLIQLYKHGEKGNAYSYWSTATSIKTISNGFKKDNHHVEVVLKDNYLIINLDDNEIYSNILQDSILYSEEGSIGFLTSACEAFIDNLVIYDLDASEVTK